VGLPGYRSQQILKKSQKIVKNIVAGKTENEERKQEKKKKKYQSIRPRIWCSTYLGSPHRLSKAAHWRCVPENTSRPVPLNLENRSATTFLVAIGTNNWVGVVQRNCQWHNWTCFIFLCLRRWCMSAPFLRTFMLASSQDREIRCRWLTSISAVPSRSERLGDLGELLQKAAFTLEFNNGLFYEIMSGIEEEWMSRPCLRDRRSRH